MRYLLVLLCACRVEEPPVLTLSPEDTPLEPAIIFAVRHAEKTGSALDSPLTDEGASRAIALAQVLRSADLVGVHSTDTVRTIETAQPTAEVHGLPVELYDVSTSLVEDILAVRGSHLVVGHSDTLPSLLPLFDPNIVVESFSGIEYDRLYVIVRDDEGASTTLLRYGEPPE